MATTDEQLRWNQVVDRHGERVFRVAFRIVQSVHDAEDISQEVFVEAYRLHQAGPVQSWAGLLTRLATLRAIDRLRRTRPMQLLLGDEQATGIEPADHLIAGELREWLREAMAQLPDQQAAVFAMTSLQQLSRQEVAETLGMSPEAVSTALHKARGRLRQRLAVFNRGERL